MSRDKNCHILFNIFITSFQLKVLDNLLAKRMNSRALYNSKSTTTLCPTYSLYK
jgi:hypothetical protein